MGASWTGPLGGAIFLLDCSGKTIAATNLGAVKDLRLGPILPVGQTVEIIYVSGTGTGAYQTSVGLAVLQGSKINILWKHLVFDREAFASGGYDYTDRLQWKLSPDGKKIVVTGLRKVGVAKEFEHGWKPGTTHALPDETYCWKAAEDRFDLCP